ncbi:hypothetical protein [Falsiroseomonas sp.]|uniref:hypothetical protein n=1 Tax=Falsiroseomonas sp. TaxID=2870721 RepID=UPI003F72EDD1
MNSIAHFLMPFAEIAINVAGTLLFGLGAVAAKKGADWLNLSAEDKVRGYFLEALDRAIAYAEDAASQRLQLAAMTAPTDNGPVYEAAESIVGDAAAYMRGRVPDALAKLKIGPTGLDDIIRARRAQK